MPISISIQIFNICHRVGKDRLKGFIKFYKSFFIWLEKSNHCLISFCVVGVRCCSHFEPARLSQNCAKIFSLKTCEFPEARFEPSTVGWEARTWPRCNAVPPTSFCVSNDQFRIICISLNVNHTNSSLAQCCPNLMIKRAIQATLRRLSRAN